MKGIDYLRHFQITHFRIALEIGQVAVASAIQGHQFFAVGVDVETERSIAAALHPQPLEDDEEQGQEEDDRGRHHNAHQLFYGDGMLAGDDQIVFQRRIGAVVTARVGWAQALEAADDVDASASVVARIRLALVDVDAAQGAGEAAAFADGRRRSLLAEAAVFARIRVAVAAVLAAFAAQLRRALAAEIVIQIVALAVE